MSRRKSSLQDLTTGISRDVKSEYDTLKTVVDNLDIIIAASNSVNITIKYLGPSAVNPSTRLDGSPIEDGDYYLDTTDGQEGVTYYDLASNIWIKSDASLAISAQIGAEAARDAALISENTATTKASEASVDALSASNSEAIAVQAALDSVAAKNLAESAATASSASQTASAISETNSGTSETNSATSASNSETSNLESQAWAESPLSPVFTGAPVGSKSAKTLAGEASADAVQVAADKISTGNDAAQTASDRVQTGLDASSAAAAALTSTTKAAEAATSAGNALTSETNAGNSETAASISETNAETAETAAASSASTAAIKASEASTSASNASTSETNAGVSETNASSSEANASISEGVAITKASEASVSASDAATSEGNALISETNASNSETAAGLSESAAALSETNARVSEVNAEDAAAISAANANYKGEWSGLTGALNIPASVKDGGAVYMLNNNLVDVTLSQPSANPSDWFLLGVIGGTAPDSDRLGGELPAFYQEKLVSGSNIKTVNGEDVLGSGNVEISIGSGGYAANVYLTDLTSVTVGTYNQISYTPDALQTIVNTVCNNNEVLAEEYIFDGDIQSDSIPAGEWSFHFHRYVSEIQADSYIRFEFFLREAGGAENVIFSVSSKSINDTVEDAENISFTKDAIPTNQTDRAGVKVYVSTTRNQDTTVSYIVGDGVAAYFTAPIAIRHSQMRARDAADSHPISAITNLSAELSGKEPAFTKNTGFNKNLGTTANTVAEGNHSHTKAEVGLSNVDNTSDTDKPISMAQQSALDGKVDDGQVLTNVPSGAVFTDTTYLVGDGGLTEKNFTIANNSKLDGIEVNANNYTHPVSHSPSIITQDTNNRFVTDAEKAAWNNKADSASTTEIVIPHTVSGELTAGGRENQLRDSGAFTLPLANSVAANTVCLVTLPDEYQASNPTVTRTGTDLIQHEGSTDTVVNIAGSVMVIFTSNGIDKWFLDVVSGSRGADGINGINMSTEVVSEFPGSPVTGTLYIKV